MHIEKKAPDFVQQSLGLLFYKQVRPQEAPAGGLCFDLMKLAADRNDCCVSMSDRRAGSMINGAGISAKSRRSIGKNVLQMVKRKPCITAGQKLYRSLVRESSSTPKIRSSISGLFVLIGISSLPSMCLYYYMQLRCKMQVDFVKSL